MTSLPGNPAVAVIGAGAAGIGASLTLTRLGVPHLVLEASGRVGGRAYTDSYSLGYPWDQGCHWFHSADINVLCHMADRLGHRYRSPASPAAAASFLNGRWLTGSLRADYVWGKLAEIAEAGRCGPDIAAASLLDPGHPLAEVMRHWLKLMYSAEPEDIWTRDAGNYKDTGLNLAVEDGYGALIARLARGLPIRLNTPVTKITCGARDVTVSTPAGDIKTSTVVLAVPARILQMERIAIVPALPDELAEAFQEVPMGWYEKIAIAFDRLVFGERTATYADIIADPEMPLNFELHPFGRPIAVTHVAGRQARDLECGGEAAMIEHALSALVAAFGSDLRRHVVKGTTTHWSSAPYIGGAYSCARPGKAELRKRFAAPLHERIHLAGEHVHQWFNATAHGAYETGINAALAAARQTGVEGGQADPLWLPA